MATPAQRVYSVADVSQINHMRYTDQDSDIRYMTLVDLYNMLISPGAFILDFRTACATIDSLLPLLDDRNGDVQSQALKCVGPLGARIPHEAMLPYMEKLTYVKTDQSQDKSIPPTATRALVTSLPRPINGAAAGQKVLEAFEAVSRVLIPRLLGHLVNNEPWKKGAPTPEPAMLSIGEVQGVNMDVVDLTHETIRCFGSMFTEAEMQALEKRLMDVLDDPRTGNIAKKKAVASLSILAMHLSDLALSHLVSTIIEGFRSPHLPLAKRRLLITLVGSLARTLPKKFGHYLLTIASFVFSALSQKELDEEMAAMAEDGDALDPAIEEVKEAALVTLDDFLSACGNEMRNFTTEAIDSSLRFVIHDPMGTHDEDMNGMDDDDTEDGELDLEDEDFEEDADMSDGDDGSWKVRRCAANVIYTIISTRSNGDLLENGTLYDKVAPALIKRLDDKDESVRLAVISALALLIKKTGANMSHASGLPTSEGLPASRKRRRGRSDADMFDARAIAQGTPTPAQTPSPVSEARTELGRLSASIARGAAKVLSQKSLATKQASMTLLGDFARVRYGGLAEHLEAVLNPIAEVLKEHAKGRTNTGFSGGSSASTTSTSVRLEALHLLRVLCETHSSRALAPCVKIIVPALLIAIKDSYVKVSAAAVLTAQNVINVLTPPRAAGSMQDFGALVASIFDAVMDRISTRESDVEVKKQAIETLGVILARTSTDWKLLTAQKRSVGFEMLQERLKNETTRVASARAIDISISGLVNKNDFSASWAKAVTVELANQLRKSNRELRSMSLLALRHFIENPIASAYLDEATLKDLVDLLLPIINPDSITLLSTAMAVLSEIIKKTPTIMENPEINAALCGIVVARITGSTLDAFLSLIETIGTAQVGKGLMTDLLRKVHIEGDPFIVGSAIGALLASGGSSVGVTLDDMIAELKNGKRDAQMCLALYVLGEAGLRMGQSSPLQPTNFLTYFDFKSETVPRAAAVALGRAGAGNIPLYLTLILSTFKSGGAKQVLLLHSIKEILLHASRTRSDISPYTGEIWQNLISTSKDEDSKAVGAECMGRLISIDPTQYLPSLQGYLKDQDYSIRGMVIQAVRFAFSDSDEAFDEVLRSVMPKMLVTMLTDSVLENRRLALTTLNAAMNHKIALILPHLSKLLPYVNKESQIDPSLIREVQMGPFKHKVDDGLEIRKSAYETLHVLMETAFNRMNTLDLFDRVIAGLFDDHDIKLLCMLMLSKLIILDRDECSRRLDFIAAAFQTGLSAKLKENAVKQEVEKLAECNNDILRTTVRLHNAFQKVETSSHAQWNSYWEWVVKDFKSGVHNAEEEVRKEQLQQ